MNCISVSWATDGKLILAELRPCLPAQIEGNCRLLVETVSEPRLQPLGVGPADLDLVRKPKRKTPVLRFDVSLEVRVRLAAVYNPQHEPVGELVLNTYDCLSTPAAQVIELDRSIARIESLADSDLLIEEGVENRDTGAD